jgi:hypothetical protein
MSWTRDQETMAAEMWAAGRGDAEIATAIGKTDNAVIGWRHRRGLNIDDRSAGIAAVVRGDVRAEAHRWSEGEDAMLRRLIAARRLPVPEIAGLLGVSYEQCRGRARHLGIEFPRRRSTGWSWLRRPATESVATERPEITETAVVVPTTAVRFLDRRGFQCPTIIDPAAPITERLVCGAPIVSGSHWCAACGRRFVAASRRAA